MTKIQELEAELQAAKYAEETAEAMKAKSEESQIPAPPRPEVPFAGHDLAKCKLGRKPHDPSRPRVMLHQILGDVPCPTSFDVSRGRTAYGMDANDSLGDCTIAGCEHGVAVWRTLLMLPDDGITDQQVIDIYSAWTGYDPSDPSTDQGAVEHDVLQRWLSDGAWGRKIQGFVGLGPDHRPHLMWAGDNLGGLYIGIALPITAQQQEVWDVVDPALQGDSAPGSWGGHCVYVVAADDSGLTVITWGALKKMTWAWWAAYCEEVWAMIPPSGDFFTGDGLAPDGLDEAALAKLTAEIGDGPVATVPAPTPVPPSPPPTPAPIDFWTAFEAWIASLFGTNAEAAKEAIREKIINMGATPIGNAERIEGIRAVIRNFAVGLRTSIVNLLAEALVVASTGAHKAPFDRSVPDATKKIREIPAAAAVLPKINT